MTAPVRLRCAIYTRKSTEEGLDQEFNSLDAQREACAAFVASQIGLGWKLIPNHYDDGGISGGTMERPALQRLLQDIRDRKVDVIVVYKIDRLTRSLTDFAKIVEVFDAASASFVSVTQQFNTTTSMGRLTLNVLLSFAQFEREVTAERIRDKIAASKAKGMWMGGTIPFGYRIVARKLVVDEIAAGEVKALIDRYLELGSVPALAAELNRRNDADDGVRSLLHTDNGQGRRKVPTKVRGGKLYYMLSNPIYIGKVKHRNRIHDGEHQPIIETAVFDTVQTRLADQAPRQRGTSVQCDIHLLNGLLFDDTGDRHSPIHSVKAGKRYRYYMSSRLKEGRSKTGEGWRIPAREIEGIIIRHLQHLLLDKVLLSGWMQAAGYTAGMDAALLKATHASDILSGGAATKDARSIIHRAVRRIELATGRIRMVVGSNAVAQWLEGSDGRGDGSESSDDLHIVDLPLTIRRRGVERRLVIEAERASSPYPDQPLIDAIARAHAYLDALTKGAGRTAIARRYKVHPEDVSRLLPLAFLSPTITHAILSGRQPADLSARDLTRRFDMPIGWGAQLKLLAV